MQCKQITGYFPYWYYEWRKPQCDNTQIINIVQALSKHQSCFFYHENTADKTHFSLF